MSQNSKALDGLSLALIQTGRHSRSDVITEPGGYMAAPTLRPPPPSTPNPGVSYNSTQISVAAGTTYTVASGQDVAIENIPGSAPRGYINLLTEYGLTTTLTNDGHIFTRAANLYPAIAINANGYGLVKVVNNGSIYSNGVTDYFESSSGTSAYGLYLTTVANVTNNGLIQVVSLDRLAIGCLGASQFHNTETGILRVDAYGSARGITLGNVINEGVIEVFGGDSDYASGGAVGLLEVSSMNNSGTIRVVAYSDFYISAAIMVHENLAVEYNNSGTIIGQYAFYDAYIRDFIPDRHSKFTNSGIIVGDMVFGKDSYTVINTGSIDGNLFFDDPHFVGYDHLMNTNTYDGRGGVISGGIFLGKGKGVVWLGDSGESVYNGGGRDTIVGGLGDDLVDIIGGTVSANGGAGFDILSFASAETGLTLNIQLGIASGVAAVNFTHFEAYVTTEYADTVTGSSGDDLVVLGAGNDTVVASTGIDDIRGDAGDDTLIGGVFGKGSVLSTFDGGAGTDTFDANAATGDLTFLATQNSFEVENYLVFSAERIIGGSGNDIFDFRASTSSLTLIGGRGDDLIIGGDGSDFLDGGSGVDVAVYAGTSVARTVSMTGDTVTVVSGDSVDTLINVERLRFDDMEFSLSELTGMVLIGSSANDTLSGNDGNDRLVGGAGNDTLIGGAGIDTADYSSAAAGVRAQLNTGVASNDGDGGTDTFSGIENLTGSAFNDVLLGDGGSNVLRGGAGYDVLIGLAGNDVIHGGTGAANEMYGGVGDDTFVVEADGDSIVEQAGEGIDLVQTNLARYRLSANVENMTYVGTAGFEGQGNAGGNVLRGGTQRDVLLGFGGDDILYGGAGVANELYGGTGDDYYVVEAGDTIVENANEGIDTVEARIDSFTLRANVENLIYAGTGNFTGIGNASNNVIQGGIGDDRLVGGAGNDTLIGGAGVDTADYSSAAAGVTAQLNTGVASNDGDGGTDTFSGIENLTGSAFNDVLLGDGGSNVLRGGAGYDVLIGLAGNDVIHGGTGAANEMYGGLGDDTFVVEADGDSIVEQAGEGIDLVQTNLARYRLSANVENMTYVGTAGFEGQGNAGGNVLRGGTQRDVLLGFGGDDILYGGAGVANELYGGTGDDYYVVEAGDTIVENANEGIDTVEARIDSFTLRANVENLIFGGTGNFVGTGNSLNNLIVGGAGDDVLRGGGGFDQIQGGAGTDRLMLLGVQSDYTITAEGSGWRIVDLTQGRDGSILTSSIEVVEFGDKSTRVLTPPANEPAEAKTGGDEAQVLPGLTDSSSSTPSLAKTDVDGPLVQPGSLDDDYLNLKIDTDSVGPQIQPGVVDDLGVLDIGTLGYAGSVIGGGQGSSMLELLSGLSRSDHNLALNDLEARIFYNPTTDPDLWG